MKKYGFIVLILFLTHFQVSVFCQTYKAIHLGGNWGYNFHNLTFQSPPYYPDDFFQWLPNLNVDWVGISVSMHLENSMDSTVELKYNHVGIPTFTDDVLNETIQKLKNENLKVYVTLAFELKEAENSEYPVKRWQLGDPNMANEDPNISAENWPWALSHPQHETFVASFFKSYTSCAAHIAQICESNNVDLFSIGTETERLMRTRSGNAWSNHYKNELRAMVDSIKHVYHGDLSYDMHYEAIMPFSYYSTGSEHLWEDLNLDVVGISAYFSLIDYQPNSLIADTVLAKQWQNIFKDAIIPLKENNPNLPLLFLEFGYTNDINSPNYPASNEFQPRSFIDTNQNLIDDGEETQATIYRTFFEAMRNNPDILEGAFLWGNEISDDHQYNTDWNTRVHFGFRNKAAEKVVKEYYLDSIGTNNPFGLKKVHQKYLKVFPNPSSHCFNIELKNSHDDYMMELFDISGVLIQKKMVTQKNRSFKIDVRQKGVYLLRISGHNLLLVEPLVVR